MAETRPARPVAPAPTMPAGAGRMRPGAESQAGRPWTSIALDPASGTLRDRRATPPPTHAAMRRGPTTTAGSLVALDAKTGASRPT